MPRSEDVKQAMVGFYERFSAGDARAFGDFITQEEDAFVLGTDWDQFADGRDEWVAGYEVQMSETPGVRFEPGSDLRGYEQGGVGWAVDQPTCVLGEEARIPLRATAVFRQEGGGWKIVNAHLSFGVPDAKLEELLPQLLS